MNDAVYPGRGDRVMLRNTQHGYYRRNHDQKGQEKRPLTAGTVSDDQKGMLFMKHMNYSMNQKQKTRVLLAWAMVLVIGFLVGTVIIRVQAEEQTITAWVLCQPGDYVNARTGHSRRSQSTGRFETGDQLELDGKTDDGFVHVVGPNLESGDYWVYVGYVSMDAPEWYGDEMEVIGTARVAARKNMTGEVRKWLQPGDVVMVYWITEEWAVTNRGFIRTEWLEVASV